MEILFVGTAGSSPEENRDTACYLIDNNILIDCGWWSSMGMRRFGKDPLDLEFILLTHCHHDHYMALPQILFYKAHVGKNSDKNTGLTIIGPKEETTKVVELSKNFLRQQQFPHNIPEIQIKELDSAETIDIGEYKLTTCASIHPVPGLCYRVDSKQGKSLVISGDTAYNEDLTKLARNADVLVHEAGCGEKAPSAGSNKGHSGGREAGKVAKQADVGVLALVHTPISKSEDSLRGAKSVFENTHFALEGERIFLG